MLKENLRYVIALASGIIAILIGLPTVIEKWQPWISEFTTFSVPSSVFFIASISFLMIAMISMPARVKQRLLIVTERKKRYFPLLMAMNLVVAVVIAILLLQALEKIGEQSHTYYLSNFPHNIRQINNFLTENPPSKSLLVGADYVGYGRYSAYYECKDYCETLRNMVLDEGVDFQMIVFSDALIRPETATQMAPSKWEEEKGSPEFEIFKTETYPKNEVNNLSEEYFFERLHDVEIEYRNYLMTGVNWSLLKTDKRFNLFFWIKDRKEAIFAFHRNSEVEQSEETFYTNDPRLVDELIQIFEEYLPEKQRNQFNRP